MDAQDVHRTVTRLARQVIESMDSSHEIAIVGLKLMEGMLPNQKIYLLIAF